MRINRDTLLKNVRSFLERQARLDRTILAVYLCGSLLSEEYLLGGSGDIDLIVVHTDVPPSRREIQALTPEIHLDISHHYHRDYRHPRQLRVDPWLGPAINNGTVLHDPQHFMDFTQASVRGQYYRPDFVLERSRTFLNWSRQAWQALQATVLTADPTNMLGYFSAIEAAVNALASLEGDPLVERRLLLVFPHRAQALGQPGLYAGLLGLLGGSGLDAQTLQNWIFAWEQAFDALPVDTRPVSLSIHRRAYYRLAFNALLAGPEAIQVLWPLLTTWTQVISHLDPFLPCNAAWQDACARLGYGGTGLSEKVTGLDAYLDTVEESIDAWAVKMGA
jgi:hypothetical protein